MNHQSYIKALKICEKIESLGLTSPRANNPNDTLAQTEKRKFDNLVDTMKSDQKNKERYEYWSQVSVQTLLTDLRSISRYGTIAKNGVEIPPPYQDFIEELYLYYCL
jgi:hypothetical protein